MARQSFKFFTPRDKPKKRGPRQHKKNKNKQEKRQKSQKRYKGQGWQYPKISYIKYNLLIKVNFWDYLALRKFG